MTLVPVLTKEAHPIRAVINLLGQCCLCEDRQYISTLFVTMLNRLAASFSAGFERPQLQLGACEPNVRCWGAFTPPVLWGRLTRPPKDHAAFSTVSINRSTD
jgi:hypothetical protein